MSSSSEVLVIAQFANEGPVGIDIPAVVNSALLTVFGNSCLAFDCINFVVNRDFIGFFSIGLLLCITAALPCFYATLYRGPCLLSFRLDAFRMVQCLCS
jgi:predicted RND superfamily exporter protein